MPGWWVSAYEASVSEGVSGIDPFSLADMTGLSPALNSTELTGMGVLFSRMQQDILAGQGSSFLHPHRHRKHNSLASKSKAFGFERVLQLLSSLKLLVGRQGEARETVRLFQDEKWLFEGEKPVLELVFSSYGQKLLLGYGEAYDEMNAAAYGVRVADLLGGTKPLALNQSVWLDLHGLEQVLFLRLEKAMQWQSSLVSLDGSFSLGIEGLFTRLETALARSKKRSLFEQKLLVLRTLGRKLVEHGVLEKAARDDYLALDVMKGLQLIWKGRPSQVFSNDLAEYETLVASYFLQSMEHGSLKTSIRLMAGHLFDETLQSQVLGVWRELLAREPEAARSVLSRRRGVLLLAGSLFLEWMIRQMPGHALPLPGELKESELASYCHPSAAEAAPKRLLAFTSLLAKRADLLEEILTHPKGSLAAQASQMGPSREFLQGGVSRVKAASKAKKAGVKKKVEGFAGGEKIEPRIAKKQAALELARLRDEEPSQYADLKEAYLKSLDANSKKIISEVRRRLNPKVFDDQIKHSLVKYMLENPSSWLSLN